MVHTSGVYYSIVQSTTSYQGNVLAFIGDHRDTKKPTLVCLPAAKTWERIGHALCDFKKLAEFYSSEANKGILWMLGTGEGMAEEAKVPLFLAIPNALVDLLRTQGPAITPYDILATTNSPPFNQWVTFLPGERGFAPRY